MLFFIDIRTGSIYNSLINICPKNAPFQRSRSLYFLGNRRSAVLRRIFCAGKSVLSAALLGVMQGRDTKPGAKETSKTVLRKFPRKSNYLPDASKTRTSASAQRRLNRKNVFSIPPKNTEGSFSVICDVFSCKVNR